MSTRRKLIVFAMVLLVAFVAGLTLGAVVGPDRDDPGDPAVTVHGEEHQ